MKQALAAEDNTPTVLDEIAEYREKVASLQSEVLELQVGCSCGWCGVDVRTNVSLRQEGNGKLSEQLASLQQDNSGNGQPRRTIYDLNSGASDDCPNTN